MAPQIARFRRLEALWTGWKTVFTRHTSKLNMVFALGKSLLQKGVGPARVLLPLILGVYSLKGG